MAGPIYNPGEPYMLQIPGGFAPGRIAHITGTFKHTANSFILKFQTGPSGDPSDEIGLCMYGRVSEGIIGKNSFTRAAGWGQEEAVSSSALARGQNFDVTILCDAMQFKIALNGQHFGEFTHKVNPQSLTYVNVASTSQDMTLACLWIEDPNPVTMPSPAQSPFSPAQVAAGAYSPAPQYAPPPPYSGGPGYAPPLQPMYQQQQHGQYGPPGQMQQGGGSKGLLGMVGGAGATVAGALGASHLLGPAKAKKRKPKKKAPSTEADDGTWTSKSHFTRSFKLSEELAAVVGSDVMPRHGVVKKLWALIKERNLQDPVNRQFAICDEQLIKVFGVERFRTFGMMKHLKNHFLEAV